MSRSIRGTRVCASGILGEGPRGAFPGRGRGQISGELAHPCTGGSSAAFSVILDMATETRDATPTRGEESARVR